MIIVLYVTPRNKSGFLRHVLQMYLVFVGILYVICLDLIQFYHFHIFSLYHHEEGHFAQVSFHPRPLLEKMSLSFSEGRHSIFLIH